MHGSVVNFYLNIFCSLSDVNPSQIKRNYDIGFLGASFQPVQSENGLGDPVSLFGNYSRLLNAAGSHPVKALLFGVARAA